MHMESEIARGAIQLTPPITIQSLSNEGPPNIPPFSAETGTEPEDPADPLQSCSGALEYVESGFGCVRPDQHCAAHVHTHTNTFTNITRINM